MTEEDDLLSMRIFAQPMRFTKAEFEYGIGDMNKGPVRPAGNAWRARLQGDIPGRLNLVIDKIHAGREYDGFYRDMDSLSGYAFLPITRRIRVNANYSQDDSNLDKDPALRVAPRERNYQIGLDYTLSTTTVASLQYGLRSRKDALTPASFDEGAKWLSMGMQRSLRNWTLSLAGGVAEIEDHLSRTKLRDGNYRANLSIVPSSRHQVTVFYRQGAEALNTDQEQRRSVGVGVVYQPLASLRLQARFERRRFASGRSDSDQILGLASFRFRRGHRISLRQRYLAFKDPSRRGSTSFLATYSATFGIPIRRKKELGALRGRLYDAEAPGRKGVANAIVRIGDETAITNRKGAFYFRSLPRGTHYLLIEPSALPADRVLSIKIPLRVHIKGGRTKRLEIGTVRAVTLSVRAVIFHAARKGGILLGQTEEKGKMVEAGGYPNLLLEVTGEDQTIRRLTDWNGVASFKIRPGRWRLEAYPQRLPELHYLEKHRFELDLSPGTERKIEIKILPRFRKMIMLEE